jgi:hypothetical protein
MPWSSLVLLTASLASCTPANRSSGSHVAARTPTTVVPAPASTPPPTPAPTPTSTPEAADPARKLQRLVDRSLSDDAFLTALARWEAALPPVERRASSHGGQTDYLREWLGPYERVTSVTYYNSSGAVLIVSQLLRGGRVVFYSYEGGDHHLEPGVLADPGGSRVATLAGPLSAWYDYDRGVGVAVRGPLPGGGRAWTRRFPITSAAGTVTVAPPRTWFVITAENEPRVFIESH